MSAWTYILKVDHGLNMANSFNFIYSTWINTVGDLAHIPVIVVNSLHIFESFHIVNCNHSMVRFDKTSS